MTTIDARPTTDPLLAALGLRPVINVAGSVSRLGGTTLAPEVREAMAAAATSFIPMVELQAWASEAIAEATGAEAGCVASGAAACLFLASAACLARLDPGVMDRLPDTAGIPNEIAVHRAHRNPYDHAIRAAGATFVEFGYLGPANPGTRRWQLEAVLSERTVAVFYPGAVTAGVLPLAEVADIARARGLPVIVDAAEMVPPVSNLRHFIAEGADLVAHSGGKAVGGPAASGFLAGRRDLILSASAQQQDMYVRPASWPGPQGGDSRDALPDPPQQPIGRIAKVGREEIVGLVVALRRYLAADHGARRARWASLGEQIRGAVNGVGGAAAAVFEDHDVAIVEIAVPGGPTAAARVIARLRERDPRVWAGEEFVDQGAIAINVQHLRDDEVEIVIEQLRHALAAG
ncbi:MAG: L-seryl-tRNA selenium transferase [Chloroflexi bacterium]|nr:L-seryl-tRNA selenium transferase [Chloroflexota bacterium]